MNKLFEMVIPFIVWALLGFTIYFMSGEVYKVNKQGKQELLEQTIVEQSFNEEEAELFISLEATYGTTIDEAIKEVKAIKKYTESQTNK
jgi:hypothetical protein